MSGANTDGAARQTFARCLRYERLAIRERRRFLLRFVVGSVLFALLLACAAVGEARAAFPGTNGKIVFTAGIDGNNEIYSMNADGSDRKNLTMDPARDRGARWSPDGKRIVFSSDRHGSSDIYVMNGDGSGVQQLTDSHSFNDLPAFTADGQHIVFETNRDGNFEIYSMNVDGSGQTNLTNNPADEIFPATSGHGKRIAFTSYRSGLARLYTMDGDGSNLQGVPGGPAEEFAANWSPRGNDLVFLGDDGLNATDEDVYVAHADGSGLVRVTNTPNLFERSPAWSPDGKRIVFDSCTVFINGAVSCQLTTTNPDGSREIGLTSAAPSVPLLDTFDSNTVNRELWNLPLLQPGISAVVTNQRFEISIAAQPSPGPFNHVQTGLRSACLLHGDYDIQIDFSLLDWSPGNGGYLALVANANGNMGMSGGFLNTYDTFFNIPDDAFAVTTDTSGTFRLVRTGSTLSGYYLQSGSWVLLKSAPTSTLDTSYTPLASNSPFPSGDFIRVAYDNFRINSGQLTCPIQGTLADWGATSN